MKFFWLHITSAKAFEDVTILLWKREKGIPSSCPRFCKSLSLQILYTQIEFFCPFHDVLINSIILKLTG